MNDVCSRDDAEMPACTFAPLIEDAAKRIDATTRRLDAVEDQLNQAHRLIREVDGRVETYYAQTLAFIKETERREDSIVSRLERLDAKMEASLRDLNDEVAKSIERGIKASIATLAAEMAQVRQAVGHYQMKMAEKLIRWTLYVGVVLVFGGAMLITGHYGGLSLLIGGISGG